jgi:membrane-bound lytic murein transglycosylase A
MAMMLAGCALPQNQSMALRPVPVSALPGWNTDHQSRDLAALLRDCERLALLPADQLLGGQGIAAVQGGKAGSWAGVCEDARAMTSADDIAARAFFERDFVAYQISSHGQNGMLFTGYYEPEVRGSRSRGGLYQTPLYGRPADLVQIDLGLFGTDLSGRHSAGRLVDGTLQPYPDRARIEAGALSGQEILWLADPVDAFFLQVQGAGRVRLPDGGVVRVAYAGQNGRPYTPIGKILADQQQIPPNQISMQAIRAWLTAHPDRARSVMDQNQDYVFFREVQDLRPQDGPPGALNVALTPGRSAAIDRRFIPLATPIWIDTTDPLDHAPWQKLVQAEDLGAAIKGPLRADLFFGWGSLAEQRAGQAHQAGRAYVLLPRLQPPSTAHVQGRF